MKIRFLLLLLLPLYSAAPLDIAGEDKKVDTKPDHVGTHSHEETHSDHYQRGAKISHGHGDTRGQVCGDYANCIECTANPSCHWDKTKCKDGKPFTFGDPIRDKPPCDACKICKLWSNEEKKDLRWMHTVNKKYPCPCDIKLNWISWPVIDNRNWKVDIGCHFMPYIPSQCNIYHKGARGCIRSFEKLNSGAGQQCCYDKNLKVLPSEHVGGGTVDKVSPTNPVGGLSGHDIQDVKPFYWCCVHCQQNLCQLYKDVRKTTTDHCY